MRGLRWRVEFDLRVLSPDNVCDVMGRADGTNSLCQIGEVLHCVLQLQKDRAQIIIINYFEW